MSNDQSEVLKGIQDRLSTPDGQETLTGLHKELVEVTKEIRELLKEIKEELKGT